MVRRREVKTKIRYLLMCKHSKPAEMPRPRCERMYKKNSDEQILLRRRPWSISIEDGYPIARLRLRDVGH